MEIQPIDLRLIDEKSANVYEAIIVAAKKARQINDDNKIEYNAMLSTIPQTGTDDESEDIENPAQLKISLDFEKKEKPHIQALNELLDDKVEFTYKK
jgi:DNA-directed RNA polymerase subunit K/omega